MAVRSSQYTVTHGVYKKGYFHMWAYSEKTCTSADFNLR